MNVLNPKSWGTALGAGLIATVALIPQAKGELVYETGAAAPAAAAANAQVEDRSTMRQALGASEKVQVTLQTQAAAPAPAAAPVQAVAPVETLAPVATAPAATASGPTVTETENMSKAELMRRERQREELKNEDILQERLEELRLRDERRRTDEVLNAGSVNGAAAPVATVPVVVAPTGAVMKEEVVTAPVTDHPGKTSLAPAMAPVAAAPNGVDSVVVPQSTMSLAPSSEGGVAGEHTLISVSPHAGISNMVGGSGYFQIDPHYSGGLGVAISSGDYFTFEVGYTYSQYGVQMASSNPFVIQAQQQAAYMGQSGFQSLNMNQNVFDAGVKVHLLGPDSRVRPYLGAGGAYAMSYINFSQQILSEMSAYSPPGANVSPDYKVSDFLGYLSAGTDVKVSRSISVGAEFRYYAVFSANESSSLSPYYGAFYGGYGGYGYPSGVNPLTQDTQVAGGSLANNSFYSILGHVTFTF